MKRKIIAAFSARCPELKAYQIEKAVTKYVEVMLREIAASIRKFGFEDEQISLSLDSLRRPIGRVKVDGKNAWVCKLLNAQPSTALIQLDFKGNEGKNSRVSFNPVFQEYIWDDLLNVEFETEPLGGVRSPNVFTKIVLEGLDSFIENTRQELIKASKDASADTDNKKYQQKLLRNFLHARYIREACFEDDGAHFFGEYWEEADSGRMYGHGTSLQRVSKEVRHAALGRCHVYDFKAASYALMTGLAQSIDPELDVAALIDYVKHRTAIRKSIAEAVGVSEKKVKTIFTSLGFGAKTVNNPYMSIRGELNQAKFDALMRNSQFTAIRDAMERVRKTVAGHFPDSFEFLGRRYSSTCPRTGKKRTNDQKLAWLYQVMESDAVTYFGKQAQDAGYQPTLFVHDCVYFKHKLPEGVLYRTFSELNITYPLLEADHDSVYPIHTKDYVDPAYAKESQRVAEHRQRMRQLKMDNGETGSVEISGIESSLGEFDQILEALYGPIGSVERSKAEGQGNWSGTSYFGRTERVCEIDNGLSTATALVERCRCMLQR